MSIETDARQEAERVEQSNDIAYAVIEVAQNKAPSEFVTLDFRYGIADALWDAGYRKVEQDTREPSDEEVEAAADAIIEASFGQELPEAPADLAHAALLAAQEVRNRG